MILVCLKPLLCISFFVFLIIHFLATEEDSVKDKTEQEEVQDNNSMDDSERNEQVPYADSPRSEDGVGKSMSMRKEDGRLTAISGRSFNCQGKNLKIKIPLTTPSRTFSAISYLVWEDLVNQNSKKCNPESSKLHVNKKKLHHAEKMIRGAFMELYKGLGYLKTYRYRFQKP